MAPFSRWGSYSSRSSIVHFCFSRSSKEAKRWIVSFSRSPYGMGWRITTVFRFRFLRGETILGVVWLFPAPVRTAQTAITGLEDFSWGDFGPRSMKSAPHARESEALCITYSWETSEYANTTRSMLDFFISWESSF